MKRVAWSLMLALMAMFLAPFVADGLDLLLRALVGAVLAGPPAP